MKKADFIVFLAEHNEESSYQFMDFSDDSKDALIYEMLNAGDGGEIMGEALYEFDYKDFNNPVLFREQMMNSIYSYLENNINEMLGEIGTIESIAFSGDDFLRDIRGGA